MIAIEFTKSPDEDILNCRYERLQRKITVGSTRNHNIIISDPEINNSTMTLSTDQDGVWVDNNDKHNYYLSNQKKVSGKKLHHVNDEITIGKTTFKIIHYKHQTHPDKIAEFKYLKKQQEHKNPSLKLLLEKLKHELKNITFKSFENEQ